MIPLSVPYLGGNEWQYLKDCLDTNWVSSAGKYVDLFEQKIAEYTGSGYAIACVNGTSALQVSLRLAGVQPGDEVIIPTLTFIAPVNAVIYNNASPIFMDADEYYNIDSEKTIRFIQEETEFREGSTYNISSGKRVSAIVPVHIWGNACWLDELEEICQNRNIAVVEDASESLGTRYTQGKFAGQHTGTIGKLGCISFNGNKIITTGGGGMILTDDAELAEKAKYLTTQSKDDPIRYIHHEVGYNFRMTNIQAALGVAQLEQLPKIIDKKANIHNLYKEGISQINGMEIAATPAYASNNHWLNVLQIEEDTTEANWEGLMARLSEKNIQTRPVWQLNHLQKCYANFEKFSIEKANELISKSLCLPSSYSLTKRDIGYIFSSISGTTF